MKTKVYQRPTTKVVKLQHQCHIMAVSNGDAGVQDYHKQSDDDWDQ